MLRFTLRKSVLVVAATALLLACYLWATRSHLVSIELARPPEWANTDDDLFDIVLLDLIDNKEFEPATGGRGAPKHQIVFGRTTEVGFTKLPFDLDQWFREKKIPPDIREDLLSRNPRRTRHFLARYQPSNPKILVRDLSRIDQDLGFSAQFPDARGYVESMLPGYSRDGRKAVVLFSFGPTPHGASGCYLLVKANGRWEIKERLIADYL